MKINFEVKQKDLYAYILGFSSTLYIFMIRGIPIFYYIAILGIFLFGIKRKMPNGLLIGYAACMVVSALLNFFITDYKKTLIFSIIMLAADIVLIIQFGTTMKKSIPWYIHGLKHSCYFQLGWCFLQFGLYRFIGLDINGLIFKDTLHTVETASRFLNGKIVLTGLCWHPSNMVPILLLIFLFSNNFIVWFACLFVVINMQSSTAIIIVLIAVMVKCFMLLFDRYSEGVTEKKVFILVLMMLCIIAVLVVTDAGNSILNDVTRLYNRLSGTKTDVGTDMSTKAHQSYYLLFPEVWNNSNIIQKLFGYGPGLSGIPITAITGQFSSVGAWVVESDIMNSIYGMGIIGTITVYAYIIQLLFNAKKDRAILFCIVIPLLTAGITYNLQYYWVFFMLSVLIICKDNNYSIKALFSNDEKINRKLFCSFRKRVKA